MPVEIAKVFTDPSTRLKKLLEKTEATLRNQFLKMVSDIKGELALKQVESLISQGRTAEALRSIEAHVMRFTSRINDSVAISAQSTANQISRISLVSFDRTNPRVVSLMKRNQDLLIRQFTDQQFKATRVALNDGASRGLSPIAQARIFRNSIGLTDNQQLSVVNFRRLLQENPKQALLRQLRDRRFDRTIERTIRETQVLTSGQIDRMVARYEARLLKFRAEVIAQSEALAAVHEGNDEMYQQAIDAGAVQSNKLKRTWRTSGRKVRPSHQFMNGQVRGFGEAFTSGDGNRLMRPGDRSAPSEDRVGCRCILVTRLEE